MSAVFADTYYFLGLSNRTDRAHAACARFSQQYRGTIVTTWWVLVELADGLATPPHRSRAAKLIQRVCSHPQFRVLPLSQSQLDRGFGLYTNRPDQEWSLTDCISFVVMTDEGLSEALTGDHHFEQAGFTLLLK
ncbi:MAG: type II toxin-antitoxin system VapC family toxin [Planctomycetes bacterium]|nr:type II toxin-antitoxin system VapC family toxin [Planctomycetota bacterium]